MPLYEYMCEKCRKEFEVLVRSVSTPGKICCEWCGSAFVQKLVSRFAVSGSQNESASSSASCASCTSHNCGSCR